MNHICMVRHGETDANKNYIVQGRIDNPLNAAGISQAHRIAARFVALGETYDVIAASPLERADATAKIIANDLGFIGAIESDPGFIERDFGDYDGQQINADYAVKVIENRIPRMEKHEILEQRVLSALTALCNHHPGKRILVVTHSHVIKSMLVKCLPAAEFHYASYLGNGSANYFIYENDHFCVVAYNQTTL
ncbi:MAG: histidine phosphatase family protein [bacterium]